MDGTKGGTTDPTTAHAKAFNATLKAAGKADVIETTLEELALVASYEVLGKCFDLTPDSTIEEVQEKRREILEDKARNKERRPCLSGCPLTKTMSTASTL